MASKQGRPRQKPVGLSVAEDADFEEVVKDSPLDEENAQLIRQEEVRGELLAPYQDGLPFDLDRIKTRILNAGANILEEMFNIGKYLIWTKEEIEHGHFLDWIEGDLGMSQQRASEFMRIAQRIIESKSPNVRLFLRSVAGESKVKLMSLMDVSDEEIEGIMQTQNFLGKPLDDVAAMSVRELRDSLRFEKHRNEVIREKNEKLERTLKRTEADLQKAKNPADAIDDDPPSLLQRKLSQAIEVLGTLERIAIEYAEEFGDDGLLDPSIRNMVDAYCRTLNEKTTKIHSLLTPVEIMDQRLHIQPRPVEE